MEYIFRASIIEQKAVNYFFDSVFHKQYPRENKIEFNRLTQKAFSYFGSYDDCFHSKDSLYRKLAMAASGQEGSELKIIIPSFLKVKKNKQVRNRKLKMFVFLATQTNGKVYVAIEMVKTYSFIDCYMFELDNDKNILRYCKTGATP